MDLVAGQTVECSATYTVVAADLDGAALVNTASATSVAPDGSEVVSDPSTARIDDVATAPAPQGSGLAITGGTIAWSAVVLAVGLLLGGGVLLLVRRRRREQGRS
jgi:LPXTG-motif cell wall-anchored protein